MEHTDGIQELTLFAGPLQRLGRKLRLVKGESNTIGLGVALGLLAWGVLSAIAILQGLGPRLFSLNAIGIHVRFLVAIPLFFVCETWIYPRMREFIRNVVESGVVPQAEVPALEAAIRRVNRIRDAGLAELLCLLLAFAMPAMEMIIRLPGRSANSAVVMGQVWGTGLPAWYLGFCLPLFRFLMFRWILHLCLWWYFLWRVQRLNLNLIPTHSDSTAGLGYLEVVHEHFMPLVLAISSVFAASFAEDVHSASTSYEALPGLAVMLLLVTSMLFVAPLCIFGVKLWKCRLDGLNVYSVMAFRYVQAFDRRWIKDETVSGESQLGTADIQSLADLTNSVNVIRNMRVIPVSRKLTMRLATCVILPLLPLLFFKYQGNELAAQLFQMVIGK